ACASDTRRTRRRTNHHFRTTAIIAMTITTPMTRGSFQFSPNHDWSRSFTVSLLSALAGTCGNRTHLGRWKRPTEGFEVLGDHQIPSVPAAASAQAVTSSGRAPGASTSPTTAALTLD